MSTTISALLLLVAFLSYSFLDLTDLVPTSKKSFENRALKVLENTPLIDGHNDLAIVIRALYHNHIYNETFRDRFENGGLEHETDLPRVDKGHQGGAFWSLWLPCPSDPENFTDADYDQIVRSTYDQIDLAYRLADAYPEYFTNTPSYKAALAARKAGRHISPYAIEGLHQIGNSFSTLRDYHRLGVRYATLTWNCHNRYADAATVDYPNGSYVKSTPLWGGINPIEGRKLIYEMNRLGMIVDLAHVSQDTMRDVLEGRDGWNGSLATPIFSHSSAYAICPHPRNVPDDILQLVKKRNSVVMVNFNPGFISCEEATDPSGIPALYPANVTLHQVVRHIRHIGELIGYDHVGLGSDFDGIERGPEGLEDVSKWPALVAELLRQGVSDKDAGKIVGGNVLRVWKSVDETAKRLQKTMKPAEDDLAPLQLDF